MAERKKQRENTNGATVGYEAQLNAEVQELFALADPLIAAARDEHHPG